MIFSFNKNDKGFDSIFNGKKEFDINAWTSKLPSPTLFEATGFDPALNNDLYSAMGNDGNSYIGNLYLYNNVTSIRLTIGKIASTIGYLTNEFKNISNIFGESADSIKLVLSTTNKIVSGIDYQQGLNAIGAIPVIGWIITIIAKVAILIAKIVKTIRQSKTDEARRQLISQFSIPLAQFSKDADEALTRVCMEKINNYDMNYLFTPRYIFDDFEDFSVISEKNLEPDNILTRAFNITSTKFGNGVGFIPGTTDLSGAIRLLTASPGYSGSAVHDVGDLYPTVRNLCISIYEMVQKPSPALFSITPSKLATKWETNIYNLLVYAELSLIKGWSGMQTGNVNSNTFLCSEELFGKIGCSKKKAGDNIKVPVSASPYGHFTSFRNHVFDRFFNGKFKEKTLSTDLKKLKWTSKNIDIKQSTPSQALKNIKETQYAIINSLNCCYVDDERFAAIKKDQDPVLNKKWHTNVSAVLNSNEWKKLHFLDIPDGEFKNELALKANKAGFKNFDNRVGPIDNNLINMKSGPSILGDPKPPSPFNLMATSEIAVPKKTTKKSENSLIGVMAIAALGAGYFAMKK